MEEHALSDYKCAQQIIKAAGHCRDPEKIAAALGIGIEYYDLVNLKGMYSSSNKHRTIIVNERLNYYGLRFVIAHEIGHDQKHRALARSKPLKDLLFFSSTGKDLTELEANIIASHILIDDEELLSLIREERTCQSIALELRVPEDLLLIKMSQMRRLGHYEFRINEMYRSPRANYLKDYSCPKSEFDFWE